MTSLFVYICSETITTMTTFREAVYMVLDMLKQISDDAYYTEEHIMFLLSKVRASLLMKKYHYSRNQAFVKIDKANYQEIEFPLYADTAQGPGLWYRGELEKRVPKLHTVGNPTAFIIRNLRNETVSVVPPERLPFVGYNKWLKHSIYCSVSDNNDIYVRQLDEDGDALTSVYLYAIYENALESTPFSADPVDVTATEFMDKRFPLEDSLMASCIELTVQELTGAKYSPEDKHNNAKDDMSDVAMAGKANTPVNNTERQNE